MNKSKNRNAMQFLSGTSYSGGNIKKTQIKLNLTNSDVPKGAKEHHIFWDIKGNVSNEGVLQQGVYYSSL